MEIQFNKSLQTLHTFGINIQAKAYAVFEGPEALGVLLEEVPESAQKMILGGGSNILFTRNYDGWILHNQISGINKINEDEDFVYVEAGAGESWHGLVLHCIRQGWAGLENLSLIPGCVGASPMQNIGAYGVELKDVFHSLEAYHIPSGTLQYFDAAACRFGYRESVFKQELKGQYVICRVSFQLRKKPVYHTSYGAIQQELEQMGVSTLSIAAISEAVIRIRRFKLPDPVVIGNAGSFFKNPEIGTAQFLALKERYPALPGYATEPGKTKVPAGWLIEQCGCKGYRKGDAGVHAKQALVLVNYGQASGNEIYELSAEIMESVQVKFGIGLEREVNVV